MKKTFCDICGYDISNCKSGSSTYYIGTAADKNLFQKEKMFVDTTSSDENAVTFSCKPKFTIKEVIKLSKLKRESKNVIIYVTIEPNQGSDICTNCLMKYGKEIITTAYDKSWV